MDKKIKAKVLKKLKTTKQTKGTLCRPEDGRKYSYCVLGVIGRVVGYTPQELIRWPVSSYSDIYKAAGMKHSHGLVSLNDKGMSFKELAKKIERL